MAEESRNLPQTAEPAPKPDSSPLWPLGMGLIPLALLVGIALVLVRSHGGGLLTAPEEESEQILFDQTTLQPGQIALHIRNSSSQAAQIMTANINDALIPFIVQPVGPIPPFGSATVYLLYPWVRGESYDIALGTGSSTTFSTTIADAETTSPPTDQMAMSLLLLGLAAGLLPVLCGIAWFPAVTRAGTGLFLFLLAIAGGLLIYLGIELLDETLENISPVSGAFQGIGLLGVSFALTFLALNALSGVRRSLDQGERPHRLVQAWIVSAGVGLQNLALTLAVGAAFSSGSAGLGMIFIIALILLNLTQGLRIIAGMGVHERSFWRLLGMGLLAGAPAVLGIWLGAATNSQMAFLVLYAIGAAAVVQALYELIQGIRQTITPRPMPLTIYAGFATGLLALYLVSIWLA